MSLSFQALKITTIDCFDVLSLYIGEKLLRYLLEETDSQWIMQFTTELYKHDTTANFMNRSRHFILPFQDNIVEIVASNFTYTKLS